MPTVRTKPANFRPAPWEIDDEDEILSDAGLELRELDDEVHGFDDQPGDDPHFAHRLDAGFELIETLHH
jgi:hypothetical protein